MKTKLFFSGILALLFLVYSCGEKLEFSESLPDLSLTTGTYDSITNIISGEIIGLGDGLVDHGHIWSTNNNPTFEDIIKPFSKSSETIISAPGTYATHLDLSAGRTETFFVRGYAEDIHGFICYADTVTRIEPPDITPDVVAAFSVTFDNCPPPSCTVVFSNSSQNASEFMWDFGDGSDTSIDENPTHQYEFPGIYEVQLIAKGENGKADTILVEVEVVGAKFKKSLPFYSEGTDLLELEDGSILVMGIEEVSLVDGTTNVVLLKFDKHGNEITNGFPVVFDFSGVDKPGGMARVTDESLVVVGSTRRGTDQKFDVFAARVPIVGGVTPNPVFYGSSNLDEEAFGVRKVDGNHILIGATLKDLSSGVSGDIFLVKATTNLGTIIFSERTVSTGFEEGQDLVFDPNNNYIVVGNIDPGAGIWDIMFFKTGITTGAPMSGFPKFGYNADFKFGNSIDRVGVDEYVICGTTFSEAEPNGDIYFVKTDAEGNVISPLQTITGPDFDRGLSVKGTEENGFLIAGSIGNKNFLAKYDDSNIQVWKNDAFGSSDLDKFNACIPTFDGGGAATGILANELFLIRTNNQGEAQ